jgi:hypothetical protein
MFTSANHLLYVCTNGGGDTYTAVTVREDEGGSPTVENVKGMSAAPTPRLIAAIALHWPKVDHHSTVQS